MKPVVVCCALAVALVLGAASPHTVEAGDKKGGPLLPPNANFRGMSFEEWNILHNEWLIATGLGGQELRDTVKKVRFFPGEFGPGNYEFNIHLLPGEAFVSPSFFVFGERYDDPNVRDDDPILDREILEFIFDTTYVETWLDGKLVMKGYASDLDGLLYGPMYFDEPIAYAQPQPRGPELNAVAALFGVGVGAVYHPLPKGRHVLENHVDSLFFGEFTYTYTITVR